MTFCAPPRRLARRRRRPWRVLARLCLEALENRTVPSRTPWPGLIDPFIESESNDTADAAHDLGTLTPILPGEAVGTIGGTAGESDVDWFRFSLDRASRVVLSTLNELAGTSLVSVLSLYNEDTAGVDMHKPLGRRLLAQADAADSTQQDASLSRSLPAGNYYVAVSGSGNRFFHPFLADSGLPGSTGDYGLQITTTDLGLNPADGPSVLETDAAAGSVLAQAPFVIRVTFSEQLDPNTLPVDPSVDQWVQLRWDPAGVFGDGDDVVVSLASINFSSAVNELQLTPMAPLQPGYYQVFLAGDSTLSPTVLRDLDGSPLGFDSLHPDGQDFTLDFQINGAEGIVGGIHVGNDIADTAHRFGELVLDQFIQARGGIGDDPNYDPTLEDPFLIDPFAAAYPPYLFNPAADVDMYSFTISGPGEYVFLGEVFAGRIGSWLDTALSLFRRDTPGGPLTLVASNDTSLNEQLSTQGLAPLLGDPLVVTRLTAGEYFVVVSGTGNVPDPASEGYFDPNTAYSGRTGFSVGDYVLNLGIRQDTADPRVLAATPSDGEILSAPPTHLVVQFDEAVNLFALAHQAFTQTSQSTLNAVYVQGADGAIYFPRLNSYDTATNQAVFLMLDALPNGTYELHVSGAQGLTDLAGNPLEGNQADPAADYVLRFSVDGVARVFNANQQLTFSVQEPNESASQAQDLGVLFPQEVQAGVVVTRDFTASVTPPADSADYYRFEVLQNQFYLFLFNNHNLPAGAQPRITDSAGLPVSIAPAGGAVGGRAFLKAGVYMLNIDGWDPADAPGLVYELSIGLLGTPDNPAPVATGALAASRFRLVTNRPPSPAPPPPASPTSEQPPAQSPPAEPPAPPTIMQDAPTAPPPLSPPATPPAPPPDMPQVPAGLPAGNTFLPLGPSSQPLGPQQIFGAMDQSPTPSVLLVVTLVSPTVTDIATPGVTSTLSSTGRLPEAAAVPGLLASLRFGPMGGVQDTAGRGPIAPSDFVAGAAVDLASARNLIQHISSSSSNNAVGGQDVPTANLADTLGPVTGCQRTLEMLFGASACGLDVPAAMLEALLRQLRVWAPGHDQTQAEPAAETEIQQEAIDGAECGALGEDSLPARSFAVVFGAVFALIPQQNQSRERRKSDEGGRRRKDEA
jgi:hypothetical protein